MTSQAPATEPKIERALVVVAHPDDVDFGSAGNVALWTKSGIDVTYCIVTDGDAGGFDPAVPRADIPGIRRAEQEAAAAEVGVSDVRFLGLPGRHADAEPGASSRHQPRSSGRYARSG